MQNHKFPYRWTLSDAKFTKDKGTVFSCFACGGGSTMGYKLAGFDVVGFNEIDPRMAACYVKNHNPKYSYIEDIRIFKQREYLPKELYNLDILDGSPPCSSFSDANNKGKKDWGKEKKFREGQAKQVLDTLFFEFIELAAKLQPKIVVAENVVGLLFERCKSYVDRIYRDFDKAGYNVAHFVVNAENCGVPQRRKRVFFIATRKDFYSGEIPKNLLQFNEPPISFREATEEFWDKDFEQFSIEKYAIGREWHNTPIGNHSGRKYLQLVKPNPEKPCQTIVATSSCLSAASVTHPYFCRKLNNEENILCSSFPLDYNFCGEKTGYVCGMSVPPLMVANIASKIYDCFLSENKVKFDAQNTLF